ncbi:hypothetical protein HYU13_05795 [Candidatus Woesearchaeota archaeon]|nr:hypothetical protein [Candidatus Woesearchaeota archaeon]
MTGGETEAAKDVFLSYFEAEEKKAKKQAWDEFQRAFYNSHKEVTKEFLCEEKASNNYVSNLVNRTLNTAWENIKRSAYQPIINRAKILGGVLGSVCAVIEEGIGTPDPGTFDYLTQDKVGLMQHFNNIVHELKEQGNKVSFKFLQLRAKKIAREKALTISRDQKQLISEIAAMFC